MANNQISAESQNMRQVSEGWLQNFKTRWGLKALKLYGETSDVDQINMEEKMKSIRNKI